MSKFNLAALDVGEVRYFEPVSYGYRDLDHLRRNLGVSLCYLRRSKPDWTVTALTIGEKLMVRRWK